MRTNNFLIKKKTILDNTYFSSFLSLDSIFGLDRKWVWQAGQKSFFGGVWGGGRLGFLKSLVYGLCNGI